MRIPIAAALAATVFAVAPPVLGQSSEEAALRTAARQLQQGHTSDAIGTLRAQYQRAPTPRVAAELGRALAASREWLEAEELLTEALSTDDRWIARNRALLDRARNSVRENLSLLDIRGDVAAARLILDDRRLGDRALPTEIWVLPGQHVIEAAAVSGRAREEVTTSEGDRRRVNLRLLTAQTGGEAQARRGGEPAAGNPALTGLGVASVVLAAGSTATGIAAVVLRQNAAHEFNIQCPPIAEPRSQACTDTLQTEGTWATVRWIAFPAAAVFTVTAGLAFWGAGRGRENPRSARLACAADPVSLSLSCVSRF